MIRAFIYDGAFSYHLLGHSSMIMFWSDKLYLQTHLDRWFANWGHLSLTLSGLLSIIDKKQVEKCLTNCNKKSFALFHELYNKVILFLMFPCLNSLSIIRLSQRERLSPLLSGRVVYLTFLLLALSDGSLLLCHLTALSRSN